MKSNTTIYSIFISLVLHGLLFLKPYESNEDFRSTFSSKKSSFKVSFNEVPKIREKKKRDFKEKGNEKKIKDTKEIQETLSRIEDSGVTNSKVLKKVIPVYPYKSRKYREEGVVLLKVYISKKGSAIKVEILKSSEFSRLDDSAITAAMTSKYESSNSNVTSNDSSIEIEFKFELNN